MLNRQNAWTIKREGTLNRFYTRPEIGSIIAKEIGNIDAKRIVDLGAGEGSLSVAVLQRWPSASITTVDVDPTCADSLCKTLAEAGCTDHVHFSLDVLSRDCANTLRPQNFDLAICNPPFYRPAWKQEFADILYEGDLGTACPTRAEATAEILFLAQNLRLLKAGGTAALIVPDGLVTGERALAFRRALIAHHTVCTVIQLPPYSFFDTEAFCFIIVLKKGREPSKPIKLIRLNDTGEVTEPLFVEPCQAERRMDFAYHSATSFATIGSTSLRQLGADIRRGSLSTVDRKATTSFIFHTGDFPARASTVKLDHVAPTHSKKKLVVAEVGDILMARVDRDLHDKITLIETGKVAITDCVYRIRVPQSYQKSVFSALTSQIGRDSIRAATKGVGARLIGKGDLLDLPLFLTD